MIRRALVGALALAVTACGTTTVDPSIAASADTGVTTTLAPISADASLVDLVGDLADSMRHLDEQVIEGDTDDATLARIEEIWVVALPLAREHSIDMEFGLAAVGRSGPHRGRTPPPGRRQQGLQDRGRALLEDASESAHADLSSVAE